jgi:hypothetical protein
LLAPHPTPKLEDQPLLATRNCLFNIFAATLHIWKPFLHLQPEDTPCHGDRYSLITEGTTSLIQNFEQMLIYKSLATKLLQLGSFYKRIKGAMSQSAFCQVHHLKVYQEIAQNITWQHFHLLMMATLHLCATHKTLQKSVAMKRQKI